jgi:RNA polymerase sigma-70 factor (ECF subfamily)
VTPTSKPSAAAAKRTRDAEFAASALPHLDYVARVARALARDDDDADDLVQETYLRAYRYWDTFQEGTDCRRWLSQICRNAMVDSRRRGRLESPVDDTELESLAAVRMHQAAQAAGLGDMYARLDLGPAIMAAIARLEPVFRDVVVLSDIEGLSYEEIAAQLEIPIGTVRSRLYRGRRHLQEQLMVYALDAGLASPGNP